MENGTSIKEASKLENSDFETQTENDENSQLVTHPNNHSMDNKENSVPNNANNHVEPDETPKPQRRSDEPSELKFEKCKKYCPLAGSKFIYLLLINFLQFLKMQKKKPSAS